MCHGLNLLCLQCFLDNYIVPIQGDLSLFTFIYWDSSGSTPFISFIRSIESDPLLSHIKITKDYLKLLCRSLQAARLFMDMKL